MAFMRAKMKINKVAKFAGGENLSFQAVCKEGVYPDDGSDENNSFARFTPNADLEMTVCNPDLLGQFKEGDTFYLDFSKAE